jgi:uncharacterized NAD(P)/FAD-binding protein YdhS
MTGIKMLRTLRETYAQINKRAQEFSLVNGANSEIMDAYNNQRRGALEMLQAVERKLNKCV